MLISTFVSITKFNYPKGDVNEINFHVEINESLTFQRSNCSDRFFSCVSTLNNVSNPSILLYATLLLLQLILTTNFLGEK